MIPLQTEKGFDAQITIPFPGSTVSEHMEQTEILFFFAFHADMLRISSYYA